MHSIRVEDFPHLDFGDKRRDDRFVTIINNISRHPGASIPRQNESWYETKATYEFFKNEDVSIAELNKTLMHYGATQVGQQTPVLIIHDITTVSYNDLQAEGLGYLANKEGRGILCYSTLALTPEGLPLSLLYQHTWTRPPEQVGKAQKRRQVAFEQKESYRWYAAMSEVNKLLGNGIGKIHIADREADIYELFFHAREPDTELLIRARHNRSLADGGQLWDSVAAQALSATVTLEVPDDTRKKKRKAAAEVRYQEVEILRPAHSKTHYESVVLRAIEIKEKPGSKGKTGEAVIHWRLLTTLAITCVSEVLRCVKWYTFRWLIERFHYVLKSGTKIEELQLKQAKNLQKAIAVYSLAAFRVMQLVYEARQHPQARCEVALTKAQWVTLYVLIHKNQEVPKQPPSLEQALLWIGRLGGHLGRKSDGPPGLKTVWRGYQKLCDAANVYQIINHQNLGKA